MCSLLLFEQSCERYSLHQISSPAEASKKNILEWHLRIPWSAQLDHDVNQNCQSSDSQSLIPRGKLGGGWRGLAFRWSLPGLASGVEQLPLHKLALCQGRFQARSGQAQDSASWEGEGQLGWAQFRRDLMARVVLPRQTLRWPMALVPLAWQLDFQLHQVELSNCIILFQGLREHTVSSFPIFWFVRGSSLAPAPYAMVEISARSHGYFLSWQDSKDPCQRQERNGKVLQNREHVEQLIKTCASEPGFSFACLHVWYFVFILNHKLVILLPTP